MTMEQEQHPHSHLFTLRVWEESLGGGKAEWRGRVQDIASGDTLFFRDWPGLVAVLLRMITNPAVPCDGEPAQQPHPGSNDE